MSEDKRWQRMIEKLRETQGHPGLNPMDEELDALDETIPLVPLDDEQISSIVEGVLADSPPRHRRPPLSSEYSAEVEPSKEHEEELVALHRKEGESDPEAEELLRKLREDALNEADGDNQ